MVDVLQLSTSVKLTELSCTYCTQLYIHADAAVDVIQCKVCHVDDYCSVECLEKDKKWHQHLCEWNVRVMNLYFLHELKKDAKKKGAKSKSRIPASQKQRRGRKK